MSFIGIINPNNKYLLLGINEITESKDKYKEGIISMMEFYSDLKYSSEILKALK